MIKGKKILVIAPHPDDEAIGCGGLIMKAKREKAEVFVLFITVGNSRQFITGKTDADIRFIEAKNAARFGNFAFEIAFQGEPFMKLDSFPQKDLIEKIEDISKKFKPDIVVIPFRQSFDQDHRATASACITAFRPIPKHIHHQPSLILETEEPYTWSQDNSFIPNFYVDISGLLEEKLRLLACHKTQLREDPFPRSPENLKRLAGLRGCDISARYAEGYNLLKGQLI